jgi:phage antirepressor YoqD-like protein
MTMHTNCGTNQWKQIPNPCIAFRDRIQDMVTSFYTAKRIAKELQITERQVGRFLKAEGLAVRTSACEKNRELVLKMAKENCSLKEIARTVGTNDRRVRQFLDREGVQRDYPTNYGGARHPNYRGGRIVTRRGYVYIRSPNHTDKNHLGYVLEHRLVMEKMIGRRLLPTEVVHHKNGKKGDNRPENLELFSENGKHLAFELKGRVPKWTKGGWERMQKSAARGRELLRTQIHWRIKRRALLSQKSNSHSPVGSQTNQPSL